MGHQRTPPPGDRPKLASLELGRFLAALYVLLAHLVPDVNAHAAPGAGQIWHWLGVTGGGAAIEYFFVLSGFVMICAHLGDFGTSGGPWRFWWKRARRIFPMYWLALLVPLYYLYAGQTPLGFARIASLAPVNVPELLPPAWTLRFEMAFYLMFGLCLLPYIGKPLLALWVFLAFWHWWPAGQLQLLHLPRQPAALFWFAIGPAGHFLSHMEFFFFAGLGAGWVFTVLRPGRRASLGITLSGIVMIVLLRRYMNFGGPHPAIEMIMLVAAILAVTILGVAGLEWHGLLRLPRLACTAGTLSYPLYILHAALLMLFWQSVPPFRLGSAGLLVLFWGQLIAVFAISFFAAYAIDQPLQRWMRHWGRAKPEHPAGQKAAA